ncbi:hypothetical protein ACW9YV_27905 (plasmid) [Paraburkholderia strydomiana]
MSWHHGDWLSFAQAVAATLAVFVALGVVFVQDHVQRRNATNEAERKARVLATLIDAQVIAPFIQLRDLVVAFDEFRRMDPSPSAFKQAIRNATSIHFRLTPEQLVVLMPLPKDCAGKLAGSFSRIDAMIDYTQFIPDEAFDSEGHVARKKASERMHLLAADAYALLNDARDTLREHGLVRGEVICEARAKAFPKSSDQE